MIKINGVEVSLKGHITLQESIKEDRNFGNIVVLSNRKERYEELDIVDIDIDGIQRQYLVHLDRNVTVNKNNFEHDLSLIENSYYFSKQDITDRRFDRIGIVGVDNQTIGDVLNTYKRELEYYKDIKIEFLGSWLNKEFPEKQFGGDFHSVVKDLFRSIVAKPKYTYNLNNGIWTIEPFYTWELNKKHEFKSHSRLRINDPLGYASTVKSQLKNAVMESFDARTYPSGFGSWVYPKSTTAQNRESSLAYTLPSKILNITQMTVLDVPVQEEINILNQIDLTDHVVTQEQWEALRTTSALSTDINSDINKRNTIIYNIGAKEIKNLFTPQGDTYLGFTVPITNLINAVRYQVIKMGYTLSTNYSVENVKAWFRYRKMRDIDVTHERNHRGDINRSTEYHSQSDGSINITRYMQNLKSLSNRLGNVSEKNDWNFKKGETPYQLKDYDDEGRAITDIKYTLTPTTIKCEYELTENYANVNGEYALSRTPSKFSITDDKTKTNVIINEYLEVSKDNKGVSTRLNQKGRNVLLDMFNQGAPTHTEFLDQAIFRSYINEQFGDAIAMEVQPIQGGNNIGFHVGFDHSLVAGYKEDENDNNFQQPIIYTDEDGTLSDFNLFFSSGVTIEDTERKYPLVDALEFQQNALTEVGLIEPLDLNINESFAATYQIHFVSDNKNLIFGTAMAKYNHLTKLPDLNGVNIIGYVSSKPYRINQEYVTENEVIGQFSYDFDLENRKLTIPSNIDYWALAIDEEIVIAGNGINDVYFNFLSPSDLIVAPYTINVVSNLSNRPINLKINDVVQSQQHTNFNFNAPTASIVELFIVGQPDGYEVDGWYQNNNLIESGRTLVFTASENTEYEARFKEIPSFDFNVNSNRTGGEYILTIENQNPQTFNIPFSNTYIRDTLIMLEAAPNTNDWIWEGWYENDVLISTDMERLFAVTRDRNIEARYKAKVTYDIDFYIDGDLFQPDDVIAQLSPYPTITPISPSGTPFNYDLTSFTFLEGNMFKVDVENLELPFVSNLQNITISNSNYVSGNNYTVPTQNTPRNEKIEIYYITDKVNLKVSSNTTQPTTIQWRANKFNSNTFTMSIPYDEQIPYTTDRESEFIAPNLSDYTFDGWFENGNIITTEFTLITKTDVNRDLEMRYRIKTTYKVEYYVNGEKINAFGDIDNPPFSQRVIVNPISPQGSSFDVEPEGQFIKYAGDTFSLTAPSELIAVSVVAELIDITLNNLEFTNGASVIAPTTSTPITNIFKVYYQAAIQATEWVLTTDNDFDGAVNYQVNSCPSTADMITYLDNNFDARNYTVGHIVRLRPFNQNTEELCGTYYFKAQ